MSYRRLFVSTVFVIAVLGCGEMVSQDHQVPVTAKNSEIGRIKPGSKVVVIILPAQKTEGQKVIEDVAVSAVDQTRHIVTLILPPEVARMVATADSESRLRIAQRTH